MTVLTDPDALYSIMEADYVGVLPDMILRRVQEAGELADSGNENPENRFGTLINLRVRLDWVETALQATGHRQRCAPRDHCGFCDAREEVEADRHAIEAGEPLPSIV
jgi:hypothetical protein